MVLEADKPTFVEFYAPWCFHCRRLVPIWEKFAEEMKGRLQIGRVDCTQHNDLRVKYKVDSYPTLKLFMRGKTKVYNGQLNAEGFKEYLSHNALRNATVYETNRVSLHYLDCRGDAEVVRLSLEAMGIPYDDIRYKNTEEFKEKLPSMIPNLLDFPPFDEYHPSPVITMGDVTLTGMTPILRHVGREFDLYGDDDIVVVDEINEVIHNLDQFRKAYLDVVSGDCHARRTGEIIGWMEVSNLEPRESVMNGVYASINPKFRQETRNKGLSVLYENSNGAWSWFDPTKNQWLLGDILDEVGTGKGLAFVKVDPKSSDFENQKKYPWKIQQQEWEEFNGEQWVKSKGTVSELSQASMDALELVVPVKVTAISSFSNDQSPENLINGKGLSDEKPYLHDNNGNANTMWHTKNAIDIKTGWLEFSFGNENPTLTAVMVWNLNQPDKAQTAAITRLFILFKSSDQPADGQWQNLGEFNLEPCDSSSDCPGQQLDFKKPIENVMSIKFEVEEVASGLSVDYIGLSEVRFVGSFTEEHRMWEECKEEYKTKMMKWLVYIDELVEKNQRKGGHLAGTPQPSIADFYAFDMVNLQVKLFNSHIMSGSGKTVFLQNWYVDLGTGDLLVDYITSDRRPQNANPNHYYVP